MRDWLQTLENVRSDPNRPEHLKPSAELVSRVRSYVNGEITKDELDEWLDRMDLYDKGGA